jgi:glycosyltransferase involved in cell wall biosynthesis
VLFVSRSLRSVYEAESLLPAGRGEVVGAGSVGGVDVDRFSPDRYERGRIDALRHSLAIPTNHAIALTVGRICVDKGLMELQSLATRLADQDLTFVVVGAVEAGNDDSAAMLFALDNVRHVPFTREVAPYFLLADVHLFLSHREGFGNVALEAASCGLPTIGFDVVGLRDSITHGVSGVRVPLGNTEEVAQLLADHLVRPGKFRAAFPQARAWAAAHFGREVQWNAFLDYFRSVVGGGRANGVGASGSNHDEGI